MVQESIDILLISVGDVYGDRRVSLPLALPVLKARLVQEGFSVKCIDGFFNDLSLDDLYSLLNTYHPKIVGFSATAYEVERLTELTRKVKSFSIEIPVILGGYCCLVEDLLLQTQADVVCHGEGDITIVELVKFFIQKGSYDLSGLRTINGISYLDSLKNHVIHTDNKNLINDLDCLPFPDFSDFDFTTYGEGFCVPFYSQRGCYNNCAFCDIIPFYGEQRIRSMNPSRIVEWLSMMHTTHNFEYFNFTDDNFMSTRSFLEDLLDQFESSGILNKVWINFQTRTNDIIRFHDLMPRLKQIIFSIEIGVESFCDAQLQRYKKDITREENIQALKILNELDIPYNIYYMFLDAATTLDEIKINIDTIKQLEDIPNFSFPEPLPEIVVNYEYNSLCDLYGEQSVNSVDFLRVFYEFLQETEEIRKVFVLYWGLRELDLKSLSKPSVSNFQASFLKSLKEQIAPKIVDIGYERLDRAYQLAEKVFNGEIKMNKKGTKKIQKEIDEFNGKIAQILSPLAKMGMDFDALTKNI